MGHDDIWAAIDMLAARNGVTASGLARLAGLDPTTFNKSKRMSADGDRPRWPSTESIAKALSAAKIGWEDFGALLEGRPGRSVPLLGFAQAGDRGFFDDAGFPTGEGWEEIRFPGFSADSVYALEIAGDSMLPVYRPGDRVIVAPGAALRRGDRVVAKLTNGEIIAKELGRMTEKTVDFRSLNPSFPPRVELRTNVLWMARILWSSQ